MIELTTDVGKRVLVNKKFIRNIEERPLGCSIGFDNGWIIVKEFYDDVKKLLEAN